jgi:two-component system KDP operon response regulator KdpE
MSTGAPTSILVVEDEQQIRRFVRQALEREGHRVFEADTVAQGLIEAGTRKPDLVVLDLGLPDGDGAQFVLALRAWSSTPVLVLSARTSEQDKIDALDAGADDYLTKPFSVGELLARTRALLRRLRPGPAQAEPLVRFGEVAIDLARRQVTRAGAAVHLTAIEYQLLVVMVSNAGKVLTHRHLLREVWGPAYSDSTHYLRVYVGRLRRKLEVDPAQPRQFVTEIGVGYRFQL